MMVPPLTCTILTPYTTLLEVENLSMVIVPGCEGDLGIMAGHLPLVTTVRSGKITLRRGDVAMAELQVYAEQKITASIDPFHVKIMMEEWCPLTLNPHMWMEACPNSPLRVESAMYGTYKIDRSLLMNLSEKQTDRLREYLLHHKGAHLSKGTLESLVNS